MLIDSEKPFAERSTYSLLHWLESNGWVCETWSSPKAPEAIPVPSSGHVHGGKYFHKRGRATLDKWYLASLAMLSVPGHCSALRKKGVFFIDHFVPDWMHKALCLYQWDVVDLASIGFEADVGLDRASARHGRRESGYELSGGRLFLGEKPRRKHRHGNPETFNWGCVSFVQQGTDRNPRMECRPDVQTAVRGGKGVYLCVCGCGHAGFAHSATSRPDLGARGVHAGHENGKVMGTRGQSGLVRYMRGTLLRDFVASFPHLPEVDVGRERNVEGVRPEGDTRLLTTKGVGRSCLVSCVSDSHALRKQSCSPYNQEASDPAVRCISSHQFNALSGRCFSR